MEQYTYWSGIRVCLRISFHLSFEDNVILVTLLWSIAIWLLRVFRGVTCILIFNFFWQRFLFHLLLTGLSLPLLVTDVALLMFEKLTLFSTQNESFKPRWYLCLSVYWFSPNCSQFCSLSFLKRGPYVKKASRARATKVVRHFIDEIVRADNPIFISSSCLPPLLFLIPSTISPSPLGQSCLCKYWINLSLI